MGLARIVAENAQPVQPSQPAQPAQPAAPSPGKAQGAPSSPEKMSAPGPARAKAPASGEMHVDITLKLRKQTQTSSVAVGKKAPAKFPAIGVQNRTQYTIATCALLLLFVASLVIAPSFVPRMRLLGTSLQGVIGIASTVLLMSNFLVAARRRGQLGLGGRGHYAIWVGLHLLSTLGALAVLTVHVSGRHGYGAAFLAAVSVALVSASGIPGAILWQRTTGDSNVMKVIKRNWLRLHIVLLAAFLVGLIAHVFQVTYF